MTALLCSECEEDGEEKGQKKGREQVGLCSQAPNPLVRTDAQEISKTIKVGNANGTAGLRGLQSKDLDLTSSCKVLNSSK